MEFLIISGGDIVKEESLKQHAENRCVIGVDKGIEYAYKYDIKLDFLIGDMDSVNKSILEEYEKKDIKIFKNNTEKNETDTENAFNLAAKMGATDIKIICATGKRLDHTFANIALLKKGIEKGIKVSIISDIEIIEIYNKSFIIKKENYKNASNYFSIKAYESSVSNINIIGAKYEIENYTLETFDIKNTSNEFLNNPIKINFKEGLVLLFINLSTN